MHILVIIIFILTGMASFFDGEGHARLTSTLSWAILWVVGFWLFGAGPFG